jgi:hypothetical protein
MVRGSSDELFAALDGQVLRQGGREWHVEIYGVFQQEGSQWLQLVLRSDVEDCTVTVALDRDDTVVDVIAALTAWLENRLNSQGRVRFCG